MKHGFRARLGNPKKRTRSVLWSPHSILRMGSRCYMSRKTMAYLLAWLPRDPHPVPSHGGIIPMFQGFAMCVYEGEAMPTPRMIRRQLWLKNSRKTV